MNVNAALEARAQLAEGSEPRVRALDYPAVATEPIIALDPFAGDAVLDTSAFEMSTAARVTCRTACSLNSSVYFALVCFSFDSCSRTGILRVRPCTPGLEVNFLLSQTTMVKALQNDPGNLCSVIELGEAEYMVRANS